MLWPVRLTPVFAHALACDLQLSRGSSFLPFFLSPCNPFFLVFPFSLSLSLSVSRSPESSAALYLQGSKIVREHTALPQQHDILFRTPHVCFCASDFCMCVPLTCCLLFVPPCPLPAAYPQAVQRLRHNHAQDSCAGPPRPACSCCTCHLGAHAIRSPDGFGTRAHCETHLLPSKTTIPYRAPQCETGRRGWDGMVWKATSKNFKQQVWAQAHGVCTLNHKCSPYLLPYLHNSKTLFS